MGQQFTMLVHLHFVVLVLCIPRMEFKIVTIGIEHLFALRIAKNMKVSCVLFGLVRCVIKLLFRCLRIHCDKLKLENLTSGYYTV